jgi:hypothetical protein
MKNRKAFLSLSMLVLLVLTAGCAYINPPIGGVTSVSYPHPQACTTGEIGSKTGRSGTTMVFFIVSVGDASVVAAARNGGITKIKTIDHKFVSIFGVIQKYYTIVTGD